MPSATVPPPQDADEILEPQPGSLARQYMDPRLAVTLTQLAALEGLGVRIIDKRAEVLDTAWKASLKRIEPEDVTLFKRPDGRIFGYVSAAGCERARPIWGIRVFNVSDTVTTFSADGKVFACRVTGDAQCNLTGDVLERMVGVRSSDEDFAKDKHGPVQQGDVEKAARANLDGNCCRTLMGLRNVPLEEFAAAWQGSKKSTDHCAKGRGFGTAEERLGATKEGVPDTPPMCPHCKTPGTLRQGKGGKPPFYGCRNWEQKGHPKWTLDLDKWVAELARQQPTKADIEEASRQDTETAKREATREPGAEG